MDVYIINAFDVKLKKKLTVFECFSNAERSKRSSVLFHKVLHCLLVSPSILSEAPPNGLSDKELFLVSSLQTEGEEHLHVCLLLELQLHAWHSLSLIKINVVHAI